MKILITGITGNLGHWTLEALLHELPDTRIFGLCRDTRKNRRFHDRYRNDFQPVWGDITDPQVVSDAVRTMDVVLHLAAIIPPQTYKDPAWSDKVNVGGTRNVLASMEANPTARLIFTSSIMVYGRSDQDGPLRTTEEPCTPVELYGEQKTTCEALIQQSPVPATIVRIGAAPPISLQGLDPYIFSISPDSRVEFVHPADTGLALARCASNPDVKDTILNIGGGLENQLNYRQFFGESFEAMGVGALPDEAFGTEAYCTDWMDTQASQSLLQYQQHSWQDWIEEMRALLGPLRYLMPLVRPIARWWVLRLSPYR